MIDLDDYKTVCLDCNEECNPVEETFGYAGTHCNNGKSGIHCTGAYVSDCCGADMERQA